jgi:alpha-L-fucosidase 2
MVRGLLTYNALPNLFTSHPPFQVDGNLGIPAAMAEMLIQSHTGEIQLLPALPRAWAVNGSFSGLRARGGYTVNCQWENGQVVAYEIISSRPGKVRVRVNGIVEEIEIAATKAKE